MSYPRPFQPTLVFSAAVGRPNCAPIVERPLQPVGKNQQAVRHIVYPRRIAIVRMGSTGAHQKAFVLIVGFLARSHSVHPDLPYRSCVSMLVAQYTVA